MSTPVRIQLLGGFVFDCYGQTTPIASQRLQSLLAYLALNAATPQSRQRLAFLLWPDSSESQSHTNLRTLIHRLHSVMSDLDHIIQVDTQLVGWHPDVTIRLDAKDFEAELQRAVSAQETGAYTAEQQCLERAIAHYTGDLLPDCYDEWVLAERERLRQQMFTALERLSTLLEQQRAYTDAITYMRRLVHLDPLNEIAYLTLMRLHILNGERASALRVYHACTSVLDTELGITPRPALQALYEQILSAETSAIPPKSSELLVGRTREWQQMQAVWQIVTTGQARLLLLSGEAGIGKTRLAEEMIRWASRQGITTAMAHCYTSEGELSYAPITAWLRSEVLRPNLAHLTPMELTEVARLAPELSGAEVSPVGPLTEQWQRQRLFEALGRAIVGVGRPTLLMLDDLQWCMHDALEWLHFLLRMDARSHLLVVGTVRTEEVDAEHPLTRLVEALRREDRVTEITLGRLSQQETAELATHLVGRVISEEQNAQLFTETEGNPLFIVEMIRAGPSALPDRNADARLLNRPPAPVMDLPPVVQAIIARRLRQVTPSARVLLDVAAVIGRSFTYKVLARAASVDEDALLQGLDELWQRRIVRESGPEAYDFTHDKLRSVASMELSAARQRVLHRRVAEALEEEYHRNLDTYSGQLAVHFELAAMPAQAAHYYQRAALHARHLYANETALSYCNRALMLLGEDSQPPETTALYDQMAELLHLMGRYDEARDLWQRALELTPPSESVTQAQFYRKLGNAWRDQYHYDEAQAAYDAAEAVLGDGPMDHDVRRCWMQILFERISTFYWLGQVTEMFSLIDQLRPALEQYGAADQERRLHQLSAVALLRQLRYGVSWEAVNHASTFLQLTETAGNIAELPAAYFQLGFALLWANDLASAEKEFGEALLLAERSADISLQARCLTYLTVIARKRDELEHVQRLAARSLHIARIAQMPDYIGAAHGNMAWAAWRTGDLAAAHAHGQEALAVWDSLPAGYMFEWIGRWPLIGVLLRQNDGIGVSVHARALLDERQQRPLPELETALAAAVHAADTHDPGAVTGHLEAVTELARQQGYL